MKKELVEIIKNPKWFSPDIKPEFYFKAGKRDDKIFTRVSNNIWMVYVEDNDLKYIDKGYYTESNVNPEGVFCSENGFLSDECNHYNKD